MLRGNHESENINKIYGFLMNVKEDIQLNYGNYLVIVLIHYQLQL